MDRHLAFAESLAHLMDSRFSFFGIRFGIDPILDWFPGIGDAVGLLVSLYIVWIASEFDLPQEKMAKILLNICIDFLIGLIPIAGYIGDIFYRANLKNITLIKEYLKAQEGSKALT